MLGLNFFRFIFSNWFTTTWVADVFGVDRNQPENSSPSKDIKATNLGHKRSDFWRSKTYPPVYSAELCCVSEPILATSLSGSNKFNAPGRGLETPDLTNTKTFEVDEWEIMIPWIWTFLMSKRPRQSAVCGWACPASRLHRVNPTVQIARPIFSLTIWRGKLLRFHQTDVQLQMKTMFTSLSTKRIHSQNGFSQDLHHAPGRSERCDSLVPLSFAATLQLQELQVQLQVQRMAERALIQPGAESPVGSLNRYPPSFQQLLDSTLTCKDSVFGFTNKKNATMCKRPCGLWQSGWTFLKCLKLQSS